MGFGQTLWGLIRIFLSFSFGGMGLGLEPFMSFSEGRDGPASQVLWAGRTSPVMTTLVHLHTKNHL